MASSGATYRFGPFELRVRTRELCKHGLRVRVRPQAFRVLEILVQAGPDVVTREDLRIALWPETTFVDFEHGLNNAIKELRRALGDSATKPVYVETLPRVGYRLTASVESDAFEHEVPTPLAASIIAPEVPPFVPQKATGSLHRVPSPRWILFACLTIAVAVVVAGYLRWWVPTHSADASGRVMLAVLPFDNLTGDPNEDYLGDGLTQELISQLGQSNSQRLGVIARTSVMQYRGKERSLSEISRALGVQYALEGTARRDNQGLRVSVQLVDANARAVWSETYNRPNLDVLAIQEEIAREISLEIMRKVDTSDGIALQIRPRAPVSTEAYDLYLKGSYFLNKRSVAGLQQGITYFRECVSKAPSYAPAYASLANSYLLLRGYAGFSVSEMVPKARNAATRAVDLDPNLPEAHLALALIAQNYDWDWQTAEREFRKSLQLNQNDATAHHWLGEHLAFRGRFEEALTEFERARRIDPLSMIIATDEAVVFYYSRQYDEAISRLRAVRELEPNFGRAGMIVYAQVQKQEYEEAIKSLIAEQPVYGENPWYWAQLAYVSGRAGNSKEASRAMKRLKDLDRSESVDPGVMVWASLGFDDQKLAISWLEKAYSQHSDVLLTLKVDPAFDPLRSNPRFQQLVQMVQLN